MENINTEEYIELVAEKIIGVLDKNDRCIKEINIPGCSKGDCIEIEFRCNKYDSPQINELAKSRLDNFYKKKIIN